MADVWDHPQLAARQRWTEVATSSGPVKALLPPGNSNAYQPRMEAVPALGEHTDTILAKLGLTPEAVAELRAAGTI